MTVRARTPEAYINLYNVKLLGVILHVFSRLTPLTPPVTTVPINRLGTTLTGNIPLHLLSTTNVCLLL